MKHGYSKEEAQQIVKKRLAANPKRREHYSSDIEYEQALKSFADKQREIYAKNIKGYHSCWSKNFYKYNGLSEDEKIKVMRKIMFCKDNPNFNNFSDYACPTKLSYYLNKGMTEEEAKAALKERQSTFSLKKCIEKYGEEEGTKRFKERQEKWLKSLDTPENREKIKQGQLKGFLSATSRNYSIIAMNLFRKIISLISDIKDLEIWYKDPEYNMSEFFVWTNKRFKIY